MPDILTSPVVLIWVLLLATTLAIIFYIRSLRLKAHIKNSQLRRAFDKLKQNESTLSLIYENSHDFLALIQPVGAEFRLIKVPKFYLEDIEKHHAIKAESLLGQPIDQLYDKILKLNQKEKEWRLQNLNKVMKSSETLIYDEVFIRPDGSRGDSKSSLIPIAGKKKVDFILYVSRDITHEKKISKELHRAVDLFQALVEHNPAAIALFDSEGKIQMVNKKFTEYSGFDAEDILGKDASSLVPKEHLDLLLQVRREIAVRPRIYHFGREKKLKALRKDRSTYDCELMITPVSVNNEVYAIAALHDVSFYRDTEKKLRDSTEQLQSLVDNLPGTVYRVDATSPYLIRFVSETSNELLGLTPKEVYEKGLAPKDVIDEGFHQQMRDKAANALLTGTRQELTVRTSRDFGSKWLIDRFKPVKMASGETFLDGILIDITDRKENEERLRTAIEGSQQGMWDWNLSSNKVTINQFQSAMLGYDQSEVENSFEWWANKVHPKDVDRIYKPMIEHIKGQTEFFEAEYRLKTKAGDYKWILVRGKVIDRDKDGRAKRALGVHLDIHKRKVTEVELRKSEERLEALISNLPGMVYRSSVKDAFAVSFASKGVEELTGYKAEQFVNGEISIYKLMKSAYRLKIKEEVDEALANNRPFNLIYEIETPNGTRHVVDKGQEMESGMIEGIITDITERVVAEEKIIQTIIETEDRERQRIARELHDNLGQKLTTASLNFNALKSDINELPEIKEKLTKGISYLTQAISDAREISHNLMPRSIEDFGFVLAVESLIEDLNQFSSTNFQFYHNLKEEQINDYLGIHLYRITQEAINNILKYAQASNVTLQLMKYEDSIIWSIEDDGIGFNMSEVMKDKHFGLDSIRHRVQIMSGFVEIESREGRGTTITVELPLTKEKIYEQNTNSGSR